jgi:hypothetical protein
MLSISPNFTRVKFWLEVPPAGNSGGMATGSEPELAFAMTYVVRTSSPLDPTTDSPWGARQYWQVSKAASSSRRTVVGEDWAVVALVGGA